MIDRPTVDRIIEAANIVEVVSEFVSLKKAGVNYKGLCPFHNEKTPSFIVSPSKGLCHCFSCGKGGTAVGFLMEHEQLSYPEALRWLARKYNIEIKERELSQDEKLAQSERESLFILNDWAMKYFQENLKNTDEGLSLGMEYLRARKLRDDIINKFSIGYSLKQRDALAKAALKQGFKEKFLLSSGLCYKKDDGQLQDRYSGRVIFPIRNSTGRVVAFGGRILSNDKKQAKYVNSPESDIYHKSNELFGIYLSKSAISKNDCCFLVEGYTDVTSMHQSGIENVVASSGTSLTLGQIKLISRYTSNITVLYDGDSAGIHASIRGIDMLLSEAMNVKVLLLPDGEDPDSFAQNHTKEEFQDYIQKNQRDFIEFKADLLLKDEKDPIKRSEAINSILKSVSQIDDQIIRATYIKECSRLCSINEATLVSTINKFRRAAFDEKRKEKQRKETLSHSEESKDEKPQEVRTTQYESMQATLEEKVEYMLAQLIVRYASRIIYRNVQAQDGTIKDINVAQFISLNLSYDELEFKNPLFKKILNEAILHCEDEGFSSENFFMYHSDINVSSIAARMLMDDYHLSQSLQMNLTDEELRSQVEHILVDFRFEYINKKLNDLKKEIDLSSQSMNIEKTMQLMTSYKELQAVRNKISKERGQII